MILLLILSATFAYILYFYYQVSKYPKGPFPIPFFGNALQMTNGQLPRDLERWRVNHGDVFTIWAMTKPIVVFMRYDVIKEALVTYGDNFTARSGEFPENIFQCVENGGVIFSSGDNWREQRRTALHILRDFGVGKHIMEQKVHEELEHFVENVKSLDVLSSVDFRMPIQVTVANIINQLLYGFSYPHRKCPKLMLYADSVIAILNEMFASILMFFAQVFPALRTMPFLGYLAVGRHVEKFNWCMEFVKSDVKAALENFSKDDEPTCFVQSYYKKMETNDFLNVDQLYNVCSDFFMAGMETTSTTLRWAVLYFAKHPEIQEKLRQEVVKVVGFNRLTSLRDRSEMPYTSAVIVELQRISNIVAVNLMRKCEQDVTIGGVQIRKGMHVLPNVYGALVDEEKYEQPYEFKPERFLKQDGSLNSDLVNCVIAFGMGKRQCAGESLARLELFLGVSTIVQKFKLFPCLSSPVDMEPQFGSVLLPKPQPLKVEIVNPEDYN